MTGCSMPGFPAFCLIHMNCTRSSLLNREQQLWGPPLCYISIFVTDAPPGWLKGDETPCVCQPSANGHHKGHRKPFWGAGYGQYISVDTRTWMPPTWRRGYSQTENVQDALSLRGYQSRIRGNNSHTVEILACFKSESHSRDLCAFLCYLFSGDLLVLAKIVNKGFYGSCCSFRKGKTCFLAVMSCDSCEWSKNFSLVLCLKNLDKGENLIYILPFCLTAKLLTLSESSPPHCYIRLEKNSMWCFWFPSNQYKKCQWRSCHKFSADKQKTTFRQCRILFLYL